MRTVFITGAAGFVGKNLIEVLRRSDGVALLPFDVDSPSEALDAGLAAADVIIHLAGVNRPGDPSEFETGNAGFTETLCGKLETMGRCPSIVFASSIQAELDNPYGVSKRKAEDRLKAYATRTQATVTIFRFKNIFGKWCRPNYNSVVATFCYNVAHDLPLTVTDPGKEVELVHIDDVVRAIVGRIEDAAETAATTEDACEATVVTAVPAVDVGRMTQIAGGGNVVYADVSPSYRVTLGALAGLIHGFKDSRKTRELPEVGSAFVHALYSTYLSYLEPEEFGYRLETKTDNRGALAEFIRTRDTGQVFVSRTKPGVMRGNHFHHTKTEKFLVLEGEAVIRFRQLQERAVIERRVSGGAWEVVDIPPGYTHSIENVGAGALVTLFWASEPFDPARPDTYSEVV